MNEDLRTHSTLMQAEHLEIHEYDLKNYQVGVSRSDKDVVDKCATSRERRVDAMCITTLPEHV
jgi:hypothetical protein